MLGCLMLWNPGWFFWAWFCFDWEYIYIYICLWNPKMRSSGKQLERVHRIFIWVVVFAAEVLCLIHLVWYVIGFESLSFLIDRVVEEIGLKAIEHSPVLIPVLLTFLKDSDSIVARQSIVVGTHLFCSVLEEMALQVSISLSFTDLYTYAL